MMNAKAIHFAAFDVSQLCQSFSTSNWLLVERLAASGN